MVESKVFNVVRSTLTGITNSLILLILNLISRKLFLQYIGLEYLSVAQVITNLLTVFSFTELGLSNSVMYMLYEPVAKNNQEKIKHIIYIYRRFNRYVGGLIGICALMFLPFLHLFIKTNISNSSVYIMYILNLLTSVSSYFYTYRNVLLGANQKDYVASIISTIVSFIRIIIQSILIYLTHDYFVFLISGLIASVFQNALVYTIVGRMYPYINRITMQSNCKELIETKKELVNNMASMASVKIAAIVINDTDNILVSWIDTLIVGICANYTSISIQLKGLITIFHQSLLHSVGIASAEKSNIEKYELFEKVLLLNTFIVGGISVCLGVLWNDFIYLWIGQEYLLSPMIYFSLLLNFVWGLLIAPVWIFRDANGLFIYVKKMLFCNAILNVVISIILGHLIGVAGIFFATVISDIFTNFWYDSNLLFKKIFKKKNAGSYYRHIVENIIVVFGMIVFFSYLTREWNINLILWICKGMSIIFIYILWFVFRYKRTYTYRNIKENMLIPFLKKYLR